MSALDGFEVIEKENVIKRKKWNCLDVLNVFIDSGNECMGRHYGDDIKNAMIAFRAQLKRTPMPVRACRRGDMVILMREDEGE